VIPRAERGGRARDIRGPMGVDNALAGEVGMERREHGLTVGARRPAHIGRLAVLRARR
jgi:hypothetical protein